MTRDLALAFRQLLKRPATSAAAIVALAIGLAVNTVAFSAVNALLFKDRTATSIEGAGWVLATGPGGQDVSAQEFARLTEAAGDAMLTAAEGRAQLAWQRERQSETVWALVVSPHYFQVLRAQAMIGRVIGPGDSADTPVAVVSERFWRDRLDRSAPGTRSLTLNGTETAVVGVLPDNFAGPGGLYEPQVWVPLEARRVLRLPETLDRPASRWLTMIGQLGEGVAAGEAAARLQGAAARLAREEPGGNDRRSVRFVLFADRHPEVQGLTRVAAAAMSAVSVVLLLALFNVANLLLARSVEREREVGIRVSLGAGRGRVIRQFLAEGLVLATLAAVLAGAVAAWSQQLLAAFAIPIAVPQRLNVVPDSTVAGFLGLMVLLAAVLPVIAPALHAARVDLVRALTAHGYAGAGGRRSGVGRVLVLLQVAGSTALLIVAMLFVQSFAWSQSAETGFEEEQAVLVHVNPAASGYDATRARLTTGRMLERLRGMPGVADAALIDRFPFYVGYPRQMPVAVLATSRTSDQPVAPCDGRACPGAVAYAVGPGFFRTAGIPLRAGYEFNGAVEQQSGVIVNETLARSRFDGASPIGRVVRVGETGEPRSVIGVAADIKHRGFVESPVAAIYLPLTDAEFGDALTLVVRTAVAPAPLVQPIRDALHDVDPGVPASSVQTMTERLELPRWPMRTGSGFFGTCGLLALLLATIGLAAVVAHAVSQRMREFGVRMAVGASGTRLLGEVLADGLRMVVPGIAIGIAAALLVTRGIRSVLVGVSFDDPLAYAAVALLQLAVALLACAVPARRAAAVDPTIALRSQ